MRKTTELLEWKDNIDHAKWSLEYAIKNINYINEFEKEKYKDIIDKLSIILSRTTEIIAKLDNLKESVDFQLEEDRDLVRPPIGELFSDK